MSYHWEGTYRLPDGTEVTLEVEVSYADASMGGGISIDKCTAYREDGSETYLSTKELDAILNDAALYERIDDAWREQTERAMENRR